MIATKRIVAAVGAGAVAAALGLFLVPGARADVGPAVVLGRVRLGVGETVLRLPPFGTIEATTHEAPIKLLVAVEEVNIEQLATQATSAQGRLELQRAVERDLQGLGLALAIRFAIGGLLLGGLTGVVLFHRHWTYVGSAAAGGLLLVLVSGSAIGIRYDVAAFESPRYSGSLTRARVVLETLNERIEVLDAARSRYEIATRKLSDLFVLMSRAEPDASADSTSILHVSDIHANPIGLEVTQELAAEFDVDAVIDTGDISSAELDTGEISSFTGPLDDALARSVARVPVPYLFVPGNHDSPQLRSRLSREDNVHVLDGDTFDVAGIEILGWADPTFSTTPIPEERKADQRLAMAPEVEARVLAQRPDILAVHDVALAESSLEDVPLVLAGHTHERDARSLDDTTVLTVGSTGATGLKSFTVEAKRDYEAQILYFEGGRLVAADYVSLTDLGTNFTVDRRSFVPPTGE
ncbi:MAG TPA: metallophosphoesterase [Actinomycetota bacterium]|nr:metallophosphoesterase [Actinomycetota bacterium]